MLSLWESDVGCSLLLIKKLIIFDEEAWGWFRALKADCISVVLYIFKFLLWLTLLVLFCPIPKLATERFLIIVSWGRNYALSENFWLLS